MFALAIGACDDDEGVRNSLRFRLQNSSWRGLRFHFRGSVPDAYRAVVPLFVPGIVILIALTGVAESTPGKD